MYRCLFFFLVLSTHAQAQNKPADSIFSAIDSRLSVFDTAAAVRTPLRGAHPYFGRYRGLAETDSTHRLQHIVIHPDKSGELHLFIGDEQLYKVCLDSQCFYRSTTGFINSEGAIDTRHQQSLNATEELARSLILLFRREEH